MRPIWFFAVPRIWEKLKAAIEIGIDAETDAKRRQAIEWALDVGRRMVAAEQAGEEPSAELAAEHAKAEETVLSSLRERVGFDQSAGRTSAPLPVAQETIEFFHALGVPLAEVWGMSETTGVGTCNPPDRIRIGTVGPAAPGVELKLADDGEVLCAAAR